MSRKFAAAVIALLLIILFAVSNPSPERHKQAVLEKMSGGNPLAGVLGMGILASNLATYHSVLLGSWLELDGERVSVGVLGFVWVDEEALDEA